jgi:hypothetical protein
MTHPEIDEAKATLKQPPIWQRITQKITGGYSPQPVIIEDPGLKWRREMTEIESARKAAQEEQSRAAKDHATITRLQADVRMLDNRLIENTDSMHSFAEAAMNRIKALENKLAAVEAKSSSTEIVELPNLLRKRTP